MLDDIRKLKIIVKGHERRIKSLEEKVRILEDDADEEDEKPAAAGDPADNSSS